ncbi:MAG: hypothetical protein QY318_03050 [Candidatus Dojkabacteria bacterium]|nr:MAG: hypothetical protein QY318_03050 [Candidatus Dojkabacteria bacterium]
MEKSIVIKLGGSLIYDLNLGINKELMKKLHSWYVAHGPEYNFIVFVVGGGKISRHLVSQVEDLAKDELSKHRIGMEATRTNAAILASVLGSSAGEILLPTSFGELLEFIVTNKRGTIITGGFKAGWSSDMNAAIVADIIGQNKVYKLSDIDHVYTADPKSNPDATPIQDLTWSDYFKMFNLSMENAHDAPGLHVPVGTHAAQFSVRKGLSFFVSGGKNLESQADLAAVFESGTYLHP